jgi:hypothetical protein
MVLKPWPGPPALALSYAEPSQSRCWAVTFGPAWPGLNGLGLARLPALSRAKQNTKNDNANVANADTRPSII